MSKTNVQVNKPSPKSGQKGNSGKKSYPMPDYLRCGKGLLAQGISQINLIRFKHGQKGRFKKAFLELCSREKTVWVMFNHITGARSLYTKHKGKYNLVYSEKELYTNTYRRGYHLIKGKKYPLGIALGPRDRNDLNKLYRDQFKISLPLVSKNHFLYKIEIQGHHLVIVDTSLKGNPWIEKATLDEILNFITFLLGMKNDFRPLRYSSSRILVDALKVLRLMREAIVNGKATRDWFVLGNVTLDWYSLEKAIRNRILDIQTESIGKNDPNDKIPQSILGTMRMFCFPGSKCTVLGDTLSLQATYMTNPKVAQKSVVITWFDGIAENKRVDIDELKERTGIQNVVVFEVEENPQVTGGWEMKEV